jgi:hypothetical protein
MVFFHRQFCAYFFCREFSMASNSQDQLGTYNELGCSKNGNFKNGKGQFLKDEAVDSMDVICHISKYLDVQVIFIWTIPQQSAWILPAVTCTKAP